MNRNTVIALLSIFLASCGDVNTATRSPSAKAPRQNLSIPVSDVDSTGPVNHFTVSPLRTVTIPDGATSVTFIEDAGVLESDVDISYLEGPDGTVYVTEPWWDIDPMGETTAQAFGQSTVTLTIPHGDYQRTLPGEWKIKSGCEVCPATLESSHRYDIENRTSVKVNVILVSQTLDDTTRRALRAVTDEFVRLFNNNGIRVSDLRNWSLDSPDTYIVESDFNDNGQPDAMDRLFRSVPSDDRFAEFYVNIFLVQSIQVLDGDVLGWAGGLPGPPFAGTPHSGVVINTYGGLSTLSAREVKLVANTMAHEAGHYLGLFHPSERGGENHDPVSDTPECDLSYDSDGDDIVGADECVEAGGSNLMFWTLFSDLRWQESLTPGQRYVVLHSAMAR